MSIWLKAKAGAAVLGAIAGLSLAAPAHAITIFQTYNTGVNAAGLVNAPGTPDTNYTIVASNNPNFVVPVGGVAPKATFKSDSWSTNDAVGTQGSSWISPFTDPTTGEVTGSHPLGSAPFDAYFYDYVTTFDVGTVNLSDVFLQGQVQSDNFVEVFLNGAVMPLVVQPDNGGPGITTNFMNFTAFGAAAGFQQGVNTLRFRVTDYGVVTGLRVDGLIAGAVPEPGAWAMLIVGFGLVASQIRRRRRVGTMAIA